MGWEEGLLGGEGKSEKRKRGEGEEEGRGAQRIKVSLVFRRPLERELLRSFPPRPWCPSSEQLGPRRLRRCYRSELKWRRVTLS